MTIAPIPLVPLAPPTVPPLPQDAAPTVPPAAEQIPLDQLVQYYRDMRDRKAELAAKHTEEMEPITKAIAETADQITAVLAANGSSSMKTSAGTAVMVTNFSYSMGDPGAFRQWMDENPQGAKLLGNTISKESLEEYLGAGNQLPPGIKPSSYMSLRVNKPTAK